MCDNGSMRLFKIILTDMAGVGLIILAFLTGWIPGPGGTPLLLAGLGLLAINHEWARRLLRWVKDTGVRLAAAFFKDHPLLMLAYDFLALVLLIGGIYILINIQGFARATATVSFFLSLAIFLGNRQRLQRITERFRKP